MIKYSYKDKELKVPTGVGNNNNGDFEEGYELGYEEGVEVSFPTGYASGWTDGHVSGVTEQKAKLVSTAITENATYSREDGFNEVVVNVQRPLETLSVSQSGDVATYTPGEGYYGIGELTVDASGYGSLKWQEGVSWMQGQIAQQAIALSFSGNGEWQKDFFDDIYANRVVVNVPIDEIYQSGYTSGYTDGYNRRDSIKVINFFSLALGLNYGDSGVTMENIDHITWGSAFAFYSDGTSWPVVEGINTSIQYDSAGTKMILFEGDTLNDAGFGEVLEPSIDFHFHESVSNFQVKWLWLNYYVYNGQMMGGLKVNLYNSPQSGKDIVKTLF